MIGIDGGGEVVDRGGCTVDKDGDVRAETAGRTASGDNVAVVIDDAGHIRREPRADGGCKVPIDGKLPAQIGWETAQRTVLVGMSTLCTWPHRTTPSEAPLSLFVDRETSFCAR